MIRTPPMPMSVVGAFTGRGGSGGFGRGFSARSVAQPEPPLSRKMHWVVVVAYGDTVCDSQLMPRQVFQQRVALVVSVVGGGTSLSRPA